MTPEQKAELVEKIMNCGVYCRLAKHEGEVGPHWCIALGQLEGDARNNKLHPDGPVMTVGSSVMYAEACIELGCAFPEELRGLARSDDFPVDSAT